MISALLLIIMINEGFGIDTLSCLSRLVLVIARFAFIDEMYIINAAKSVNTLGEDLIKHQQRVVGTCESTLRATGGALQSDKFYWYIINYKYI